MLAIIQLTHICLFIFNETISVRLILEFSGLLPKRHRSWMVDINIHCSSIAINYGWSDPNDWFSFPFYTTQLDVNLFNINNVYQWDAAPGFSLVVITAFLYSSALATAYKWILNWTKTFLLPLKYQFLVDLRTTQIVYSSGKSHYELEIVSRELYR